LYLRRENIHSMYFFRGLSFIAFLYYLTTAPLFGQHAVITRQNDTIRCSRIEIDRENDRLECQLFGYPDSMIVLVYSDIKEAIYHLYPRYPNLKYPTFVLMSNIGISFGHYTPGFGNLNSQTLLRDELKRGFGYGTTLSWFNKSRIGLAAQWGGSYFYSDRDSIWGKEQFTHWGLGVSWLSSKIGNDLFFSANAIPTISHYKAEGKILHEYYIGEKTLYGLHLDVSGNFHITEKLSIQLKVFLDAFHKKPDGIGKSSPTIGKTGLLTGFILFL